ncbi:MAG: Uma2 family endonuclease [Deltaproteobacteria bacterium]|nr:Uma2 family endonuclease [Deltaproteobacteria bacterium]
MVQAALKTERKFTYEDYSKLPEGAPYQLIEGDLVMTPSPSPYHQRVSKRIEFLIYEFAEVERGLGEVLDAPIDIHLGDAEVFQPDIIFVSKDRLSIIGDKNIEGAPDLVVEVLSPSTAYYDLKHKKTVYAASGVKEYWIVDPIEKSVEVYANNSGEFTLDNRAVAGGTAKSRLIEGFTVALDKIF